MSAYPEHDKLRAIQDKSQCVGGFIEWLSTQGFVICKSSENGHGFDEYFPLSMPINTLLAAYFEIDLNRLEDEKCAMLDAQRAMNAGGQHG